MPPRKKAKASAASTPLAESQPKTPQETGPATQSQEPSSTQDETLLNDPWTDDQETQLFKSMIQWKPTGLHKHFRMISIHNSMRSHGFVTDDTPHTRIPGIWAKIGSLYDLRSLDEREISHMFSEQELGDPLDRDDREDLPEFQLPEDDFGESMWARRFRGSESDVASSPPFIPTEDDKALYAPGLGLLHELPGGSRVPQIVDTAESVSGNTPTPRNSKMGTRSSRAATKTGRMTKAQAAKNSKAQSAVSDSEEEEEDDDEDESSSESEEETAPSTRKSTRGTKAKPAPKRNRKR